MKRRLQTVCTSVCLLLAAQTTSSLPAVDVHMSHPSLQVSAVLTLADSVEIPARESGVLTELMVHEGDRVAAGSVLARIDDQQAKFDRNRAQLELEAARRQAENGAKMSLAEKALALATKDYERGLRVNQDRPGTLSAEEIEERRVKTEAAQLEIENARSEQEVARTTQQVKANEVAAADHRIERRSIVTLVSGFVERIETQLGEWVEPGATVIRIVRDDRWFVEAFVSVENVKGDLTGHPVVVSAITIDGQKVELTGNVTYFSPHVGTLDNEIRIRAEIERGSTSIAAGQKVMMTIHSKDWSPSNSRRESHVKSR